MYDASLLLSLQALDRSIAKLKETLSDTEISLKDHSLVDKAENIFTQISAGHEKVAKNQRDTEREAQRLTDRKELIESRVYAGNITNPKELSGLQEEIKNLSSLIDDQESILLVQMEETEKYVEGLEKATAQLQDAKIAHEQKVIDLTSKHKDLATQLESEEPQQKMLREQFSPNILHIYDRVSQSNKGIAVAVVEGDRCSECRLSIPTQLLENLKTFEEFVYCNSCRRILLRDTSR